jgi:chromosome segregation ATPase
MKPGAPLPEDEALDRALLSKAKDLRARARARLIKATTEEQKTAAELSLKVAESFVAKILAAPHRARDRDNKLAAELAALWRPLRYLTDVVEEQGRTLQQLQAASQQTQAAVQALAASIEADRPARDEVSAAIGAFHKDPQGAALATLARHREQDAAKEKRSLESATKKWESKRAELEADIARRQKVLDRFQHELEVEPDGIKRHALTVKLTEWMAAHLAAMDRLSTHLDERPH